MPADEAQGLLDRARLTSARIVAACIIGACAPVVRTLTQRGSGLTNPMLGTAMGIGSVLAFCSLLNII